MYLLLKKESYTVAEALINKWNGRYGVPLELHSDQGRSFEFDVFKKAWKLHAIGKDLITPLFNQSDQEQL